MFQASPQQVKDSLSTAEKLSGYYAKKYPEVGYSEFYSISLEAITDAYRDYCPRKGKLLPRVRTFIYDRFHNYLKKAKKKRYCDKLVAVLDKTSLEIILWEIEECSLTQKEQAAVEYFLKYSEPPQYNRAGFYRAVRKIRQHLQH